MSNSYLFKVNDYKEIDLVRISRENPEAEVLIITGDIGVTYSNRSVNAILLLSNQFLSSYSSNDRKIMGEEISLVWGFASLGNFGLTKCHRGKFIHKADIPQILHECREAKKSLKMNLTVDELKQVLGFGIWVNPDKTACGDLKNNLEITVKDKTLILAFNGTSKLNPEKVIVDGQIYVKEIPF